MESISLNRTGTVQMSSNVLRMAQGLKALAATGVSGR